ncbi:MAG: ATP-binding cassette domain-containing protein [Pseudomonas sp.]
MSTPRNALLRIFDLRTHFPLGGTLGTMQARNNVNRAVDGLRFDILRGETLGLVGESGCGKSTAGRSVLMLQRPTSGKVYFEGVELTALANAQMRHMRQCMQMVFQDPFASLNPRMDVAALIAEPLAIHGIGRRGQRRQRVAELLDMVGLPAQAMSRYPHEFSGGQRQRVGIARALAVNPRFMVLDEAISALDVSVQAQIVNLLGTLQRELDLTYLFIAHDLAVVHHISDRVAVMHRGRLVELGEKDQLYRHPAHPYTRALLAAAPIPDPRAERRRPPLASVQPASAGNGDNSTGCCFRGSCPLASIRCHQEQPDLFSVAAGHQVACFNGTAMHQRQDIVLGK